MATSRMFTCNSILPNVIRKKFQAIIRRSMPFPRETPRGFELLKIGAEFDVKIGAEFDVKSNFLYIPSKTLQVCGDPFW